MPNQYVLAHINANQIIVRYGLPDPNVPDGLNGEIIGSIIEFCLNERYVCVHTSSDGSESEEENTSDVIPAYYVIDTQDHNVYGPLTQPELNSKCEELAIEGLSEWRKTVPAPDEAVFH